MSESQLPEGVQNGTYQVRATNDGTVEIDVCQFVDSWDTRPARSPERPVIGEIENVAYESAKQAKEDPRYQTALIFWLKAQAGWKERQVIETVDTDAAGESRDDIVRRIRGLLARDGPGAGAAPAPDARH